MTYIYNVLRDGPIGLWSLDILPLSDSSGYDNHASYSGTPTQTRPIVAGGIGGQYLNSGDSISYPVSNVMITGRETRAFSLEAWIKITEGQSKIIGRNSSGLFLDGRNLRFSIEFDEISSVIYENLKEGDIHHVVGTYDGLSMALYINNVLVNSVEVNSGQIVDSSVNLTSSTESSLEIDTVAVYNYALNGNVINRHYIIGTLYPEVVNLSILNGGMFYEFYDGAASVYDSLSFGNTDDWSAGFFEGDIAVIDNQIVNIYDESLASFGEGVWVYQHSIDSESAGDAELYGSKLTWDVIGDVTVEYSTDGASWDLATNGQDVSGYVDLSNSFGVIVRVTVPSSEEQTVINNLSLVLYRSKNILGSDESLPATFINPLLAKLSDVKHPPSSFNDNSGVRMENGSSFSIPADTDFDGYFAVEMTIRVDANTPNATVLKVESASSQPSITTNGSGEWVAQNTTGLYIDGQSVTGDFSFESNKWHHVLMTFTERNSPVKVGGNYPMTVGYLALYSSEITSGMAEAIYDTWIGAPAIQIIEPDASVIQEHEFSETTTAFRAYAFDWAITSAG